MFEEGDVLICVDNESQTRILTNGKEYVALFDATHSVAGWFVYVRCDNNRSAEFYCARFVLSNKTLVNKLFADV